ncbi:MAG: exosortase K [Desulfobulbus sp.]|jgi:exosortase K|uniref:exosortase K n=1 Tax=Desulfobulbus sp. TaxID=895 RepID=UPI00284205B3|nr:exosortase K [Desulfobulbus sp.]MDR2549175.1 exosortase K [Desulfobulbus sp.]
MENQPAASFAGALAMAAIIAGVVLVKWCFADASAASLNWLLRPASGLVALCSGLNFTWMEGLGYYNAAEEILIAPACSGLNFFLVLLAIGWCLAVRYPPPARLGWWILGIAASAYGVGLVVNTCRILLAIFLYREQIAFSVFSPERLHRLEGVVVYYLCLCLFAMLLSTLLQRCRQLTTEVRPSSRPGHGWLAAGLYLLFTLAIPLVNGAADRHGRFIEHGLTVLALVAGVALAAKVWKRCR